SPVTGFVDVLLRSLILAAQAVGVGGVVFVLWTLRGAPERGADGARVWTLVAVGAGVLGIAQSLSAFTQVVALHRRARAADLVRRAYFGVSVARVATALVMHGAALCPRGGTAPGAFGVAIAAAAALVVRAPGTSHAAARVSGRSALLALDAIHQVASWIWI